MTRELSEAEHLRYHLEVGLTGCGVDGCDFDQALALHFRAVLEAPLCGCGKWVNQDDHHCFVHHENEHPDGSCYRVCGECWHVYRTAADLEAAWVVAASQLDWDENGDPDFVLTGPIPARKADEIEFCQFCVHDW